MKCRNLHKLLFLLMLLLCGIRVQSQDYPWLSHNNFMVEARGHYGVFWHHHFEMQHFNARYPAFEMSLYQSTYGKHEWEALYNYPYVGLTFYHSNLGNFQELGKAYALYPFINYPLVKGDTHKLTFKFGVGIGWLTNKFNNIDNYMNYSIGSHLNAAVNLSFEYRLKLTRRLISVASFGLTHFSNGARKLPNYGLNTFSGAWGLAYYLRDPRIDLTPAKRPDYQPFEFDNKKWFCIDLMYGIGTKDVSQTMGVSRQFLVHDLSAYFMAQFTRCSRAGIGVSLVLDLSDQTLPDRSVDADGNVIVKVPIEEKPYYKIEAIRPIQMTKPNISLCYSMTMDRLSYYFEAGWHLKVKPYTDLSKGNLFQKVSLRYRMYDDIYAHISLMTHFGRADYVCFGLGYRFNQKYYLNHEKYTKRHPPGLD